MGRSWWREQVSAAGPALLTLVLATTVCLLGWRGVDQAAQFYRVMEFRTHGLMLWDSGWYGGNFPLGYSVLFPAIGAAAQHPGGVGGRRRRGHLGFRPGGHGLPGSPSARHLVLRRVHPASGGDRPAAVPHRRGVRADGPRGPATRPATTGVGLGDAGGPVLTAGRRLPGHGVPGLGRLRLRPAGLADRHRGRQPGLDPGDRGAVPGRGRLSLPLDRAWSSPSCCA